MRAVDLLLSRTYMRLYEEAFGTARKSFASPPDQYVASVSGRIISSSRTMGVLQVLHSALSRSIL
uniref:Uncharacterized protein n=1 Tax=Parascaris equorum TaxID=6256 RepID=A0A914R9E2_PAREQ